ncbi:MAG: alanine dehydrogenase, partial [Lentisphaeraceae bacterium]|nr:alanine dehydrogenase [Lentisphaeraceae bacterium]
MNIGVPKEIKRHEYRVGLTPSHARFYIDNGHKVFVETGAGEGAGFDDPEYEKAGALILSDKAKLFDISDMIIKVKEPLESEYDLFHEGQILYTYLH